VTVSDDKPSILLESVSKQYRKYEDSPALVNSFRNIVKRTRNSHVWAVRDVDMQVDSGECVGVIGRNGAGKSTLLQMLAGITSPTTGRLRVVGRVAPLISVGVGFHPELTGRENVYVNATILGLTRPEIDRRFDEIVDFSGIEDFIDTPVKFYSSGMSVRLGFSVAIQVEPDIFLVDEVLGVGDLAFQMKCYDRIRSVIQSGSTVVVVSHNLTVVRNLCQRVLVMEKGERSFDGSADGAIDHFHTVLSELREPEGADLGWVRHRGGVGRIALVSLGRESGESTTSFEVDDELVVDLRVDIDADVEEVFLGVTVYAADGVLVYADAPGYVDAWPILCAGESRDVTMRLGLSLPTGTYTVAVTLYERSPLAGAPTQLDQTRGQVIHVQGRGLVQGLADLHASFGPSLIHAEPDDKGR
jgi:ABC-type polysaccharide/polyol phosphate transport system ATPase subunit